MPANLIKRTGLRDGFFLGSALLFLTLWSWSLWWAHHRWGIYDWNTSEQRLEALRATLVEFHQWPGNNPWMTGGLPLLGNPTLSIFSIPGILSLLIGTHWGLHLSYLFLIYIGFLGAWFLSATWWQERWLRLAFCLYVVANPALIYHATAGHLGFINYYFLPAALCFFLRYDQDRWSGLKAGLIMGAAFLHSLSYIIEYAFVIFFPVLLWHYLCHSRRNRDSLIRWNMLFFTSFLALCIYRITTILPVAEAFPRILKIRFHLGLATAIKAFFYPVTGLVSMASADKVFCGSAVEVCCYLGLIASLLFVASLRNRFRWWHATAVILVWASLGNDHPYYLMYWIMKLPVFSSHLCFERIRIFIPLFVGIAAVEGIKVLWTIGRTQWARGLAILVGGLLALEVLWVSYLIMLNSHVDTTVSHESSYAARFENWGVSPLPQNLPSTNVQHTYFTTRLNQGYLRGQGDSYILPDVTAVMGLEEKGYIAEFHQEGHPVEPEVWTPNRILLRGLDPTKPLTVNMNPGSPWHLNGVPLFPKDKIVELQKTFVVMPDIGGTVELTYHHPGQAAGIIGTLCMMTALGLAVYYYGRRDAKFPDSRLEAQGSHL